MHTAGLGELVALSLGVDVHGEVLYADDSAVLIQTTVPQQELGRVSYVKNCFAVLGSVPRRRNLGQAVEAIATRVPQWSLRRSRQPYRLMFSEDGQLAGVPTWQPVPAGASSESGDRGPVHATRWRRRVLGHHATRPG